MTGVITMTLAGGSDFLDLQGSGAGTVGIRIAPSGASSNSAKIIGTLNGSNTDLSFLVGGSARLNLDFNGRINGSAGIHRALSTTPDSTSGTTAYIESGTFTPAGTTGTNVTAITPGLATWNRVGRVVTISGQVSITTTAAVSSTCDISFPINSNIADANECSGTFSSLAAGSGRVIGNATNDRATFEWTATATGSNSYRYIYTYVIN